MSRPKRIKTRANVHVTESNNENDSPIFRLNDDCMRYILSFLPTKERIRVQRVCRKWKILSKLPWTDKKQLKIYDAYDSEKIDGFVYTIPIMKQVLRLCGNSLIELKLLYAIRLPPTAVLRSIKQFCPNLRSLDLSGITLTPSAAEFLAQNFKNFTSVHLGQCKSYDDTHYYKFFSANTKLHTLIMRSNTLSGWCLQGLPGDSIETIKITRCDEFSAEHVLVAFKKLEKLRSLTIVYSHALIDNLDSLLDILSKKSNFEKLSIEDLVTSESTTPISAPNFGKLINLKQLSLQGSTLLHDEALKIIGTNCKRLSKVSLLDSSKVTDQRLQIFLESLHLEELQLVQLKGLSETCFDSMHMPSLKSLAFCEFPQLTNKNLESIIQSSDKLKYIEIMNCKNIDHTIFVLNALTCTNNRSKNAILELRLGLDNIASDVVEHLSRLKVVYTRNWCFF